MALSQVGIMNAALGKLGQDIVVQAPSENSKHARALSRSWDYVLDYVQAARIWPFTTRVELLTLSAEDPLPGWEYRYDYPSDCMTAVALCDEAGVRSALRGNMPNFDFEKVNGKDGACLLADLPDAYLLYSARVTDVSRFPAHFCEALACRLAWENAGVLAGEVGLRMRGQLLQDYAYALSEAGVHELNEGRDIRGYLTPTLAVRES